MNLGEEDRAALNALTLHGYCDAARCVERLMMDGETVLAVEIAGGRARLFIAPPRRETGLWRAAAACKITPEEVTFVAVRFGCEIRWMLARAAAERGVR